MIRSELEKIWKDQRGVHIRIKEDLVTIKANRKIGENLIKRGEKTITLQGSFSFM